IRKPSFAPSNSRYRSRQIGRRPRNIWSKMSPKPSARSFWDTRASGGMFRKMNQLLKRFWIEFDDTASLPIGVGYGCGVTAFDLDEALVMLREQVFIDEPM